MNLFLSTCFLVISIAWLLHTIFETRYHNSIVEREKRLHAEVLVELSCLEEEVKKLKEKLN